MRILFVCKYNRFRSKVAEALFNKYNDKKRIRARSAGIQIDFLNPAVADAVVMTLRKYNAVVADIKSEQLKKVHIDWADKVIIVADNVDPEEFIKEGKEIEVWPIRDCDQDDEETIEERVREIDFKIRDLIKRLNV